MSEFALTYFSNSSVDELNTILEDLKDVLPKNDIANLFIDRFDPNVLHDVYGVSITDKLEKAVRKTLEYAIDTEMLVRHIFSVVESED